MPGREAGLAEKRRLLVAGHAADRDRRAEQAGAVVPKIAAVVVHLAASSARGHVERAGRVRRPNSAGGCRTAACATALVASVACTAPPVSRQSRKQSTVPKASSPRSARARAPRHIVEDPGDLGGREIGIEQQAGALA